MSDFKFFGFLFIWALLGLGLYGPISNLGLAWVSPKLMLKDFVYFIENRE